MSRVDEPLDPAEREARDALATLPAPAADPAFRRRLARAFADGTIAPGRFTELGAKDEPGGDAGAAPPAEVVRGPWRAARRWAIATAAAAAVVAVAAGFNLGPDWRVVAAEGNGTVVVDDRAMPMLHAEDLARGVRRGGRVKVQEGSLFVMAGPDLMIEITPGTEMTLPPAPNRWWSRVARARVEAGECRITTGPGFRGAELAIATPEAAIEVRGTTLAVIRDPGGTCVCVLEGTVMVGRAGDTPAPVTAGHLRFVYGDARPAKEGPIRPAEDTKLRMFRDRRAAEAGR